MISHITYHQIFVSRSVGNGEVSDDVVRDPLLLDKNNQQYCIAWKQYSRKQMYYLHGQNY